MELCRDSLVFIPNQRVVRALGLLTGHVLASREAEVPTELVVPLLKFVPVSSIEEVDHHVPRQEPSARRCCALQPSAASPQPYPRGNCDTAVIRRPPSTSRDAQSWLSHPMLTAIVSALVVVQTDDLGPERK